MKTGLLVASPQLHDPFFARTIILLVEENAEGALGFVLNRPTDVTLEAILEHLSVPHDEPFVDVVLWGGPVAPREAHLLYRGAALKDDGTAVEVPGGWCISGAHAVLARAVNGELERPFCLCLGYAGWGPGQLDEEISRGSWILIEASEEVIFATPMERRWDLALATLGIDPHEIFMSASTEE